MRGEPDVADLDDPPRLEDLGERDGILREHEVEVRDELLGLERRDVRPRPLPDLDDLHDRERPQRLAEDRPAHVHLRGQLALGGQLVAGHEALGADEVEQAVRDLLGQGAPIDDGELRPDGSIANGH